MVRIILKVLLKSSFLTHNLFEDITLLCIFAKSLGMSVTQIHPEGVVE